MSKRANRAVFVGKTRSGKTTRAKNYIAALDKRVRRTIIVNTKTELREFCDGRFTVRSKLTEEEAARLIDKVWGKYRNLHFQVETVSRREFMNVLNWKILQEQDIHEVTDEAHLFWGRSEITENQVKAKTQGAGQGIHTTEITQTLVSQIGNIDPLVLKQCNIVISFLLTEPNEVNRFCEIAGELGEKVRYLAKAWEPKPNLPGEYFAKNIDTGECGVAARDPRNPKRLIWIPLTTRNPNGIYSYLQR